MATSLEKAKYFVGKETQFHLGCLLTEQSNPLTHGLAEALQLDVEKGVAMLSRVDREVVTAAAAVFSSSAYTALKESLSQTLAKGGRIVFSGCGATGRLSILLESAWRRFWQEASASGLISPSLAAKHEPQVASIMTGGDYALVRSVENFEDFITFGCQQVRELNLQPQDTLVAISEGGETSSVIGTIHEAIDRGAHAFFLFNNPADVLCSKVERSRGVIEDKRVTSIPLNSGPMAVAGSTRMQATTFEMLVAGAALESAIVELLPEEARSSFTQTDPVVVFENVQAALASESNRKTLAKAVRFEADVYCSRGRVTYFGDTYLLDIFTDTTERAPTFMLPPFRKCDDDESPAPWAFVKNPRFPTDLAWQDVYRRPLRCLGWTSEIYESLGADARIVAHPPKLGANELTKFHIGNEPDLSRTDVSPNVAILVSAGKEAVNLVTNGLFGSFTTCAAGFEKRAALLIGPEIPPMSNIEVFHLQVELPRSPLLLWERLAVKLALNTLSTATMGRIGRLRSNWMAHVDATNKKLIDRSTRLVAELGGENYENACVALFEAMEELRTWPTDKERPSAVQKALENLRIAQFLETNSGWAIGVDNGKDALSFYTADGMERKKVRKTPHQWEILWIGHKILGAEFAVTIRWSIDDLGLCRGSFSYSGYQHEGQAEEIHFPIVKCPYEKETGFLIGFDAGQIKYQEHFSTNVGFSDSGMFSGMQMAALLNPSAPSMYFDHRDPNWNAKGYAVEIDNSNQVFTYKGIHYVPKRGASEPCYVIPYESTCGAFHGGWFEAGQIYREWALRQTWNAQRTQPNRLREIGLWVWNRGTSETVAPPVMQLQKDCGDIPVALDWYWWHSNPYDSDYPDYWPPREGESAFKSAVEKLKRAGIFCQTYINGVCWDMDGKTWGEGGEESSIICRDGIPRNTEFNKYNHHRLAYMCGDAPKFHDKIAFVVKRLRKAGLDGQYLDMIGATSSMRCFSSAHNHPMSGGNYIVKGYRKLLSRLRAEHPDFPLSTEYCNEAYMDLLEGAILLKRWRVERTLSWFSHSRRLSKDYEILTDTEECICSISHLHTSLRRGDF